MAALRLPELCLRLGIVYLVLGMALGAAMGIMHDHSLMTVHAHINLLGFASTFLLGLFLKSYPATLEQKPARLAVLAILGVVPVLLVVLAAVYLGYTDLGPVLGGLSLVVLAAYALFAFELFRATAARP